ncbi:type II IV secretion system family [Micractinium conductrix]|uniref:Type II IV secretion system family n=1 Tax=Micractinium conductrix TaxID=554055 RepID=A0A2P6VGH1_9CHLO|nr:type II IV secretion system family [Micractinium conductrix]|eukprot:PSC73185.1 type II IV secretion system family [Micractinium conductrix]
MVHPVAAKRVAVLARHLCEGHQDSRVPLAREPTCGMTFSGYAGEWVACARAANPLAPVVDAPTHLALAAAVDRQQAADAAATWQPQPQQQQAPLVTASL